MQSLLEQFLEEEATPYVRKLITDAVDQHELEPVEIQKRFEFNRFEVTLDFSEKVVLIEDVLEPGEAGELRLGLDDFLNRLSNSTE